ncbi:N-acetylglucosamine-6-phosphate deacetylase [Guptibacillus hwajinpoensis]|uniref:N-acetylglucosamine-6-phosphate deacetylase n=1 Tax=Guptibacillus hwajinpoensis TaxID=208199 RepID=UPI001CFEFED0|nr:N-acetylglucosamine-6-phosphate deacetylase [Pseudalkalibacillus hwajinpoensis]WLR60066.1 N-acetylglucosamine-6-phosphate deacetylase [Pseudalkalibacillus hwajinpoensis]
MQRILLRGGKVYTPNPNRQENTILIENDKITGIGSDISRDLPVDQVIDLPSQYAILPGMIDVHIHGAAGSDVMDSTSEALTTIARTLPLEGTTSFLATTMTNPSSNIEQALRNAAIYHQKNNHPGQAEMMGIHLEGPFINQNRAGAQPTSSIIRPDVSTFKHYQSLANDLIKLVTLAPELDDQSELTRYLYQNGMIASVGHSEANFVQLSHAVNLGIRHATHLFNGMNGLHHRDPGSAGAILLNQNILAEIIVDGIHVSKEMVDLTYRLKGAEGLLLITDAMRAKCLNEGIYDLGGQEVEVKDHKAILKSSGSLAGSILKMNEAARNMLEFTHCSMYDLMKMTSENAAKELGIWKRKGSIEVNKDADLIVVDEQMNVQLTICRGQIAIDHFKRANSIS